MTQNESPKSGNRWDDMVLVRFRSNVKIKNRLVNIMEYIDPITGKWWDRYVSNGVTDFHIHDENNVMTKAIERAHKDDAPF